jgi:hypothetical protein
MLLTAAGLTWYRWIQRSGEERGVVMRKFLIAAGAIAMVLGLVILVNGEGLRRFYGGLFFVVTGIVILRNARLGTSGRNDS